MSVSVVTVLALVFLLTRGEPTNLTLAMIYFVSALPFVFAGMIVSLAISETIERVDRVYFFDLMGAAGGCLLLVPFLNVFGGPNTVIVAGDLFRRLRSHLVQPRRSHRVAVRSQWHWRSSWSDSLSSTCAGRSSTSRSPRARSSPTKSSSSGTASRASRSRPSSHSGMMLIVIDADASTGIAKFDFNNLSEAREEGPDVSRPRLPLPGPARRQDTDHRTRRRLGRGARPRFRQQDITGVEINPIIANTIMQQAVPGAEQSSLLRGPSSAS